MKTKILCAAMAAAATINLYPTAGVVTECNERGAVVTTSTGFSYQTTIDDGAPGDVVAMLMHTNGTPETIRDDAPIMSHYVGTLSMLQSVFEDAVYDIYFGEE